MELFGYDLTSALILTGLVAALWFKPTRIVLLVILGAAFLLWRLLEAANPLRD